MRTVLLTLLAVSLPIALAHADLTAATPAQNSSVTAPKTVKLFFEEQVELRFSTFKVYPLKATGNAQAMNQAADALMARVIGLKNDAAARADTGLSPNTGRSAQVSLALRPKLAPGTYVVMWKVLSVDTHASSGRYLFSVKSGGVAAR